jgi:outer membrane receptor protein involved in Fe transport
MLIISCTRGLLSTAALLLAAVPAFALSGRIVDTSGKPIAGAEITIVGASGSARSDADGRFVWTPDPRPPFTVIVILPDGRLSRPIEIQKIATDEELVLTVSATVAEEVTVAAGTAPAIRTTPGAGSTTLTSRDLASRMPANLMQSVENVPGVNQVSEGQAAVPAVRGLARGRTLILIDDSRVTSERRVGPSATFMDPSLIDTVQVARGAGSVAYGSDAFGGVIAVRTRQAPLSGTIADGSVTFGAGIPDRRADATFARGFGQVGLIMSVHGRDVGDYDGPSAPVPNSGYADAGAFAGASALLGGGLLIASWQGDFGRDIERPRNNSNVVRFYYPFEDSHRVNVRWEHPDLRGVGLFTVHGFFGTIEQRTDQDRIPTSTRPRDIERADISARDFQIRASLETVRAGTRFELGADINGRAGLEAHDVRIQYDLAGDVVSQSDTLSVESASRVDTGLYLQADRRLLPKVTAAGGIRFDHVRNVNTGGFFGDRRVANGAAAGFGAVTIGPFDHLTFTAQLARGFRDPTLSDRFFRGPTGRGFITGNPDLEPETSVQVDLGARYVTERWRVATYYYHYRIGNLIERFQTDPDFFFFRNRGRSEIEGVEFEAQAALGRGFSLELSAQRSRGTALDDGAALDDISPDSAALVLRKIFGPRITTFARVAWYDEDHRPGPSEIAAPGHTNVDLGASWRIHDRLEIRAAIRNVLNEEYYASPDPRFVTAPGRNGFVTVRVSY